MATDPESNPPPLTGADGLQPAGHSYRKFSGFRTERGKAWGGVGSFRDKKRSKKRTVARPTIFKTGTQLGQRRKRYEKIVRRI